MLGGFRVHELANRGDGWRAITLVKRFLVTTALEETWRDDDPILFLGEWCRLHARKDRWSPMDGVVLPYHWDDRAKLADDYRYLLDFHERLLEDLTGQLNEIHRVSHSLRYWRIFVGPWLGHFTQMLFDRWCSIQKAADACEISGTVVLAGLEEALIPNDMVDFFRLYVADVWNHHVYASILEHFTSVTCLREPWQGRMSSQKPLTLAVRLKQRVRREVAMLFARGTRVLGCSDDAFFLGTYLPRFDSFKIQRRLGQVPQLWRSIPPIQCGVEPNRRRWTVRGHSRSKFEICARELIPRHMPVAYLEGYHKLVEQTASLHWPERPKVIWTSNPHFFDEIFKVWAAEKVENGSPLIIGQHGGHYGVGRWSFAEDHEIAISDRFLSWGWSEPSQPKVRPVGQLKSKRAIRVRRRGKGALLVTAVLPRYSYWMYSTPVASQWLSYFDDQFAFVESLPDAIRKEVTVRLFPDDLGWDQAGRWRERFPGLRLDEGKSAFDDTVRQSRLFISTYNATTFLESFTMNVPTVMYWNPNHWELRDSAVPYFDDLRRVGIFHETPEGAANHVAVIWEDVEGWWSGHELQEVLSRFKERYSDLPTDLLDRVETELRDAIADGGLATAAFLG